MKITENFEYIGTQQNFERDSYATLAEMKAVADKRMPDIFTATCKETGKFYIYNKNNEVDETLGKWRELSIDGDDYVTKTYLDTELAKKADTDHTHTIVNGHTVESDVPVDAKFTDTIYDDTDIKAEIAKKADITSIPSKVSELANDSNYQTAEQVNDTVTAEIAKVVANAPENFDTLKEMSDWIAGHEGDASAMNSSISDNKTAITALQSGKADKSEIPTTVAELTDSADYAKKTDIPTTLPANGGNADTVNNHTVESNVPADAVFTDTTYETVTQTEDGLMSVADKAKLDGVEIGATKTLIDIELSNTSTNPVQNKVVTDALNNKADKSKYSDTTINVGRKASTTVGDYSTAEGYQTTASENSSHAEGYQTTASGGTSHAEGLQAEASGESSHAEGYRTTASGDNSHAEGQSTTASGTVSHAEGADTAASGFYSHAEGESTNANGDDSHAEGFFTETSGKYSHAEGEYTIANGKSQHVQGKYNIADETSAFIIGNGSSVNARSNAMKVDWGGNLEVAGDLKDGSGNTLNNMMSKTNPTGTGSFSLNRKASTTIGTNSTAEGQTTTASGTASHSEGSKTTASGSASHSEGGSTTASGSASHAEGSNTTASGGSSHAEGQGTTASGDFSHAEGQSTTSSASYTHSEGVNTSAIGQGSHAEGSNLEFSELYHTTIFEDPREVQINDTTTITVVGSQAFGLNSHAEGCATLAYGKNSHTEGYHSVAAANESHAEGCGCEANGSFSHAEGFETKASNSGSHAEGSNTTASGGYSHAEGCGTTASKSYSHAEGNNTTASGEGSHAEGLSTYSVKNIIKNFSSTTTNDDIITAWTDKKFNLANGKNSHVEGNNCLALGASSHAEGYTTIAKGAFGAHAEGYNTIASGNGSHAEGYTTTASNFVSHASGKYNAAMTTGTTASNTTGTAFVIGNGTSDSALSNAFSVQFNGTVKAKSTITASTTADYAEFFEWLDKNPNEEDRVGHFVTLDGDKIKIATSEDDYILGIVSGEPFVLGNGDCDTWNGMYLHDECRRTMYEPAPKIIEILDNEGNPTGEYKEVEGEYEGTRPILNPDYDPTQEYISRFDRVEWSPIGMLGVLAVLHDGTAEVNGYVTVNNEGIATKCTRDIRNSYRVIKKVSDKVVEVIFR